jgi:rhamnosyl/mannosyltransferase
LPSIAPSEAFGIVQLEAMICGKPVISTNLPTGVPYVNQHGVTGEVVEPNNVEDLRLAIIKLLKDANLREIYGRNGFNRVIESFTKQNMVKQVMKTYKEIL